jgi:hypothetical protein
MMHVEYSYYYRSWVVWGFNPDSQHVRTDTPVRFFSNTRAGYLAAKAYVAAMR